MRKTLLGFERISYEKDRVDFLRQPKTVSPIKS